MGNKEKVLELLKTEALTGSQIAEKLQFNMDPDKNKNQIRVYLNRLLKHGIIEIVGDSRKNIIYKAKTFNSNTLDTTILKKIIPKFIELGIKINFESNEIDRIKQLYEEIK